MSDTTRFTDWSPETVEIVDPGTPVPLEPVTTAVTPGPVPDGSVVYAVDKVTAYFDDTGAAVRPAVATWAKVWTPDDLGGMSLKIIILDKAAPPNG